MLQLTRQQEKIYTELLQQQLKSDSQFQLFTDDDDFEHCIILEKLNLATILDTGKTAFIKLNRENICLDLAPKFVK